MIFIKVLAVLLASAAVWLFVQACIKSDDSASGIIKPMAEKPSLIKRIFQKPEPEQPDPKFSP